MKLPDTAQLSPPSALSPYRRYAPVACALALALAVLLVAWKTLRLGQTPLWVPFTYQEADVVVMLMYIKGVVQDGWPLTISHLSAPFSYPGPAFPMQTSTDWLLIKLLSVGTQNPGQLINVFWLLTAVMSAWSSAYAAWQLRVRWQLACAAGLLYAFLPFALMRFTHHLNLVYYMVPLHCLLAVLIAAGPQALRLPKQARTVGLIACVLQGFDYIYFSFFAALLFGLAAVISLRGGQWRSALRLPLAAIGLVTIATALNLAPALLSWKHEGKPPEMAYKSYIEGEVYGAKLRAMVLPHPDNFVRPLARFASKNQAAGFPLENENQTARLGLFGAFGLLLLLALRLRMAGTASPALDAVSALGLGTFLVITVGGLGALLNILTVPDIRGYNRFSVFLSFFAIAGAMLWLQARLPERRNVRIAALAAILLFALFSLRDQLYDVRGYRHFQDANAVRAQREAALVARAESLLPRGAMVLQLPLTGYPPIEHIGGVESYDHGRYSLWSQHLHWSWPSFSQRHRAWQNKLKPLQGQPLLDAAILSGFDAMWIDRRAWPDRGAALLAGLQRAGVKQLDLGPGDTQQDIAAIDIRAAASDLKQRLGAAEFARQSRLLLSAGALVEWKRGFYEQEQNPEGKQFRWARQKAELVFNNVEDHPAHVCVRFDLAIPGNGKLRIDHGTAVREIGADGRGRAVQFPLTVPARDGISLKLSTDAARLSAPNDPRELYFYVMAFSATTLEAPAAGCTIQ